MSTSFTRRQLLKAAAVAGLAPASLLAEKKQPASERLNVAVIGTYNRAHGNLVEVSAAGANVVALCDVDENLATGARREFPKASFDIDFRRVVDRKDIDAVLVATPDHTHAVIMMAALEAGKHVYCEKPLTHTVYEARRVAETAAKHKRVTQMGTQIHAGSNYRRVVELVRSGAIGTVREVHVWCGRSYGGAKRSTKTQPTPKGLHWDLWLGPAPERPYDRAYHPFDWRGWWDFGGGTLNDMACHHMDLPFWALELDAPTKVAAEGPPPERETVAPWLIVRYEFPARRGPSASSGPSRASGSRPAVRLTWYDGGKRPAILSQPDMPKWSDGSLFVGDKGMLIAGYSDHKLLPEKQFAGFKRPRPFIPDSIGHHKEWLEACKNGGTTTCRFGYSGALTEAVLLGTVSYRSGKSFTWDSAKLKTSDPAANAWLHKEYRRGWSL
ncbi:MAG: Gfo/Idh/MocA family oxidoreductase [Planctomycetes bacterium]|nr:Gfo/Idh/MocA family oxidoreductase [Planctomycetota bacterium]